MTDTKIKAQGAKGDDAIAPQVQINATTNEWEISTDSGKNWKSTGIKATGVMLYLRKTEWTTQVILIMSYSLWLTERPS
ncbi:hypothetical protein [Phocaeicola vulgatus]|jgi:hypothetical protein|uniref:hypothetical protein n=1 Tax=Phocaeicola vulgatus TaxID=821 RepID=UPI001F1CB45C|nr:hypothetical protein [Phocaeicola vulgatus]